MTYYPVFKNVRKILKELHLLLTPDQAHKNAFSEVPIIGFKNAKSLKNHLVRAVLPQLDREGRSKACEEVCESVKDTTKFKKAKSEETFDILKDPLDCNSNNVIYLFEYKQFKFRLCRYYLMSVVQLQSFDLDLTTIKAAIVSLERN